MNAEKLAKLQAQVRLGGKGTARRKKKVVHKTAATDDKKLQVNIPFCSLVQIRVKSFKTYNISALTHNIFMF